jgi:hypothetical protein
MLEQKWRVIPFGAFSFIFSFAFVPTPNKEIEIGQFWERIGQCRT